MIGRLLLRTRESRYRVSGLRSESHGAGLVECREHSFPEYMATLHATPHLICGISEMYKRTLSAVLNWLSMKVLNTNVISYLLGPFNLQVFSCKLFNLGWNDYFAKPSLLSAMAMHFDCFMEIPTNMLTDPSCIN